MKIIKSLLIFILVIFPYFNQAIAKESQAQEDWLIERSRHFIIYYQEDVDQDFLDKTIYNAEDFYNEITDRLGFRRYDYWLWENRAKIYLYKDQNAYVLATGMPTWSGGRAIYEEKIIETFPWVRGFFTHLLPHELGHIIFREFVGIDANVPLWFEEGVASNQEDYVTRRKRQDILKEAVKNSSLIPLEELSRIDVRTVSQEDTVNLFYAQSESVVNFLIEQFGQYEFVRLCRNIRDYKDFNIAFEKTFTRYKSLKSLDDDWQYYLRVKFKLE